MIELISGVVAGVLTPYITKIVKNSTGWKKQAAMFLSLVVCLVVSYGTFFFAGLFDPAIKLDAVSFGAIWALSQVYYGVDLTSALK